MTTKDPDFVKEMAEMVEEKGYDYLLKNYDIRRISENSFRSTFLDAKIHMDTLTSVINSFIKELHEKRRKEEEAGEDKDTN